MPDGSSSAAPVINPGPRSEKNRTKRPCKVTARLVRPVGLAAPSRGRTAMLYEPDPSAGYVVGIDVGRAWVRVAVADLSGTALAGSARDFGKYIADETEKWGKVIRAANIKLE